MITVEDAYDVIDIYGPDRKGWPGFAASDMDTLLASDKELAAYLKRQKTIDSMLDSWEDDLDGVDFEDDEDGDELRDLDEDEEPQEGDVESEDESDEQSDEEGEEDDDEPDGEGDVDVEGSDEGSDEEDSDEPEDDGEGPICIRDDEDLPPIMLDPEDLEDMDEKFSDKIRDLIDLRAGKTFNVFSRDKDGFIDITVPDGITVEAIDKAVLAAVGPLMKDLRRLIAARSQARRIPGKRSGRLHSASLHRVRLGDDRVFSRKEETPSLNTAITLLIDSSGSMGCGRLKLATETAYALGTVLNKLGIAFECIGFTDGWPEPGAHYPMKPDQQRWYEEALEAAKQHPIGRMFPLLIPRWKAFEDRWTIPVQKRFAASFSNENNVKMGSTPEGCGLEWAAKRLLQRSEDRKILICMTDGEPGATSYNDSGEPGKSDMQHSKDMVASITAAGIDLVGIGIQHNGPTKYYPNSLVIQNVNEMPKLLMGVLKRFIIG